MSLSAISPIDGRYHKRVQELSTFFSEFGLIKYRFKVEVLYFIALCKKGIPTLVNVSEGHLVQLKETIAGFDIVQAEKIKAIERTTNHDIKAVEYFLKTILEQLELTDYTEWIHFGLTSQDINNTAIPLAIKDALNRVYFQEIQKIIEKIRSFAKRWEKIPMLSRTHGQPASPTLLGKECLVFEERLNRQFQQLKALPIYGKFGGAIGNFNAHYAAFPDIDWHQFGDDFLENVLGLQRLKHTTQIAHYDNLAAIFDVMRRINIILIDFCRDIWTYISMDYFKQKIKEGEVGSSTMPHKVNPIDFENAEGNLGLANALLDFLSTKLPISRLQRDLSDSTVLRNIGVAFAHTLIAFKSVQKGMDKLTLNEAVLAADLDNHWEVLAEPIQTILRREGYPKPYEALKALTRKNEKITFNLIKQFIEDLAVSEAVKEELRQLTPSNYVGRIYGL